MTTRAENWLHSSLPCDKVLAESIIGLFEAEVIWHLGPWRGREPVEFETPKWVDWLNHGRLLGPIGFVPPSEFEAGYAMENQTVAA